MDKKKRCANTTAEQKKLLIEFVKNHENLINTKFTDSFKYTDAKALWSESADILNSCNGANKSWKEWRKTWQDRKSRTKQKKSNATNERYKTGGGQNESETFTEAEDSISEIIGRTSLEGHQESLESKVEFIQCDNICEVPNSPSIPEDESQSHFLLPLEPIIIDNNIVDPPSGIDIIVDPPSGTKDKVKKKRRVSSQRLERTVSATSSLADITKKTYELKKTFYEERLLLMKRDVEAKEKIANCLEKISHHFS